MTDNKCMMLPVVPFTRRRSDLMDREMRLSEGKTCNDCLWYQRCSEIIGLENDGSTKCDWHPSRFRGTL